MPEDQRSPRPVIVSRPRDQSVLAALESGEVELKGRIPWSSNATFLVGVHHGHVELPAIYKPERGERPLWDFPPGLWRREVAAYELDVFLGWGLVPATVPREDGPLGAGSLQLCVDAREDGHYFSLLEQTRYHGVLRKLAAFDLIANNADRKGGHCLLDGDGHIWAIDNGLCFHSVPKLRTVIWDFAGEPMGDDVLASLQPLAVGVVPEALSRLLGPGEVAALTERAAAALENRVLPQPSGDFPYPWPLV